MQDLAHSHAGAVLDSFRATEEQRLIVPYDFPQNAWQSSAMLSME